MIWHEVERFLAGYLQGNVLRVDLSDTLTFVVGCALVMHQLARRYEPKTSSHMLSVFFPAILATPLLYYSSVFSWASSLIISMAVYTSALAASIVIYRLSPWHPLANYPGPLLSRISKLWIVLATSDGRQHMLLRSLHDKYGDFVRVGPNEVSIRDVDAVVPIHGGIGCPKGPTWDGRNAAVTKQENRSIISLRDWSMHSERRKLWNKGFTSASLRDYEETIIRRGKQLVEALVTRKDGVDIAEWFGFFTFDFMGDMAFGGGFELMRDGCDKEGVWTILKESFPTAHILGHLPWASVLIHQFTSFHKKSLNLRQFAATWAKKRLNEGAMSPDLFYHLFEANGNSECSFQRVASESIAAIIAGSDTTSTVLSNLVFYFCRNQDYQSRLRQEIDQAFPNFEAPFETLKLSQLSLLNAAINEAMRLHPPVVSGVQRSVLRGTGGKMIGSRFIPEQTNLFVHTYSLQRDPRYFSPHPDEFWPDRWLSEPQRHYPMHLFSTLSPLPPAASAMDSDVDVILNHTAFIPFSFGPANCAGKNLALLEMRIIVALLVQKFDMRFAEGYKADEWLETQEDWLITVVGRLPVQLTPRF